MEDDDTPLYDIMFEMQVNLCERFPAFTPLMLRKEKARHVFRMFIRYLKYAKKEAKHRDNKGKRIIRRPAGDTWF